MYGTAVGCACLEMNVRENDKQAWVGRGCEGERSLIEEVWRDRGKAGINETLLLGGASWVDLNPKSFLLFVPPVADINEKARGSKDTTEMRLQV